MSNPHSVNDLASSFVEMAKAYERLPILEETIHALQFDNEGLRSNVQRLELKLIDKNNEIDHLNTELRAEEAKRSDAETMFLECDDAKSTLERSLHALRGEIDSVLQAVRPVAEPEPVARVEVKPEPERGFGAILPRDTYQGVKSDPVHIEWPLADGPLSPFVPSMPPMPPEGWASPDTTPSIDASSSGDTAEGSVSVDPTNSVVVDTQSQPANPSQPDAITPIEGVSVPSDPTGWANAPSDIQIVTDVRPYFGKRYSEVRGYVSLDDWLAGGGTRNDRYDNIEF